MEKVQSVSEPPLASPRLPASPASPHFDFHGSRMDVGAYGADKMRGDRATRGGERGE